MKKTDTQIAKTWEKEWWKDYYHVCKGCVNSCKQSWKIKDLKCRKYKAIDN